MPNPIRQSMADLISRTRTLIADPAGSAQVFSDQEVQDTLDRFREWVRYQPLSAQPTLQPGGTLAYVDYFFDPRPSSVRGLSIRYPYGVGPSYVFGTGDEVKPVGDWEAFVTGETGLCDASYNALTPTTSDYLTGHWTFASGQTPPVYILGKTYDIHAAGAYLLEEWAAKLKLQYSFSADGMTAQKREAIANVLDMAARLKAQKRIRAIKGRRSDVNQASGPNINWNG